VGVVDYEFVGCSTYPYLQLLMIVLLFILIFFSFLFLTFFLPFRDDIFYATYRPDDHY
jgi:hypothetical protein